MCVYVNIVADVSKGTNTSLSLLMLILMVCFVLHASDI